jgi:Domain of unknown function (DUF1918)
MEVQKEAAMSFSGASNFDHSIDKTNAWLSDVAGRVRHRARNAHRQPKRISPSGPPSRGKLVVTAMTSPGAVHRDESPDPPMTLRAEPGDSLVIGQAGVGFGIPRVGQIIAVLSPDGSPPYLVHWVAGDYDSVILPGSGAHIDRRRT